MEDFNSAVNDLQSIMDGGGESQGIETAQPAQPVNPADIYELEYNGQKIPLPLNYNFKLKENGQTQEVPLKNLFNSFRQNAQLQRINTDYKSKFEWVDKEVGGWDKLQEYHQKWHALQSWSEQNPQEFERLWSLYQSKDALTQSEVTPDATQILNNPVVQSLQKEIQAMKEELGGYRQMREEQERAKDIEIVNKEKSEIEKQYGIKLDEPDEDGLSLYSKVLKHGIDRGYPDLTSAFLTFPGMMDRLRATVSTTARNEAVKAIKQDNAAGIMSRTTTRQTNGQGQAVDVSRLSKSERHHLAAQELEELLGR